MNIEHISVSRDTCVKECEQKYKFRYHLKIIPDGPVAPYLSYGKFVHTCAEHYVREQGKTKIDKIAADVLSGKILIEEGVANPVLQTEYKKKLVVHLKNIAKLTERIGFDGLLEHEFKYDLDPPNNRLVTGFIDRLIIRGDKYFILDYKTTKKGQWRKDASSIRKDLQLRCYARAVQHEFGAKAENIRAALYYVEGPDLIATKFNEESLISAEQELLASYKRIESIHPDHAFGRVGQQCNRCDYQGICPFVAINNHSAMSSKKLKDIIG